MEIPRVSTTLHHDFFLFTAVNSCPNVSVGTICGTVGNYVTRRAATNLRALRRLLQHDSRSDARSGKTISFLHIQTTFGSSHTPQPCIYPGRVRTERSARSAETGGGVEGGGKHRRSYLRCARQGRTTADRLASFGASKHRCDRGMKLHGFSPLSTASRLSAESKTLLVIPVPAAGKRATVRPTASAWCNRWMER